MGMPPALPPLTQHSQTRVADRFYRTSLVTAPCHSVKLWLDMHEFLYNEWCLSLQSRLTKEGIKVDPTWTVPQTPDSAVWL